MSKYDRITTEELAVESLLAERRRIENAVYRSQVAVENAMESDWQGTIAAAEALRDLAGDHIGQLQRLQSHINAHGVQIFEDAYESRRLAREAV